MLAVSVLSAAAAPSGPAAWIGSPISGSVSSTPSTHKTSYGGNWSVDIKGSGTAKLYLAKSYAEDSRISARIIEVNYACGAISGESSSQRLARGGKKVVIEVKYDSTRIGKITFAHLDTSLGIGSYSTSISRWGGTLGTVGNYKAVRKPDGTYCWTGQHVHVEAGNLNGGLSCYWSGLNTSGRSLSASQYLGYVGYRSSTVICRDGL
jgi:hypothetical protein